VSQELMDYIAARHAALVAVLEMLAAEYQLSDENSSALAVTTAERLLDDAAVKLAEATEALPMDRKPVGWNAPPAASADLKAARRRFTSATLRCLSSDCADEHSSADAESEYASELLAIAARDLVRAVDELPMDRRPRGWDA
jgi:hypothetical protein